MSSISETKESVRSLRVVLLINFIPPYHVPTLKILAESLDYFRVMVSTYMEPNREWEVDWGGLEVTKQRSITLRRTWSHPQGFSDTIYVQLPYAEFFELYRERPDLIISTEMGVRSFLALTYRLLFKTTRVILWLPLSEHTEKGRGRLRILIRSLFVRCADAVFVNGESGARYLRKLGIDERKIFRVPYPTDKENLYSSELSRSREAAYRMLYVGQLIERKGIFPFLHSLSLWAKNNPTRCIEFNIVGTGELSSKLMEMALPENLELSILGHQDYRQLRTIYADAGIAVLPTFADEWGIVVNEALASGLPVLGSIFSQAVEELVEEGKSGWLFTPDDPNDTYRAIDKVMSTPIEVLSRMRIDGQAKALDCAPDKIVKAMLDAINYVSQ